MRASDIDRILGVKAQSVSLGDLLARAKDRWRATWRDIPLSPGIYAVCLRGSNTLSFAADAGLAQHAVPVDPNLLHAKHRRILAVAPTDILTSARQAPGPVPCASG